MLHARKHAQAALFHSRLGSQPLALRAKSSTTSVTASAASLLGAGGVPDLSDPTEVLIFTAVAGVVVCALVYFLNGMGNETSQPAPSATAGENTGDSPEIKKRGYTLESLRAFDGSEDEDGNTSRIYVGIRGQIYDVTERGANFYGPDGPYAVFAGRDATRGLAKMSTAVEDVENPRTDDLTLPEVEALNDWIMKFDAKYPVVGHIVQEPEHRDYTLEDLRQYDGKDSKPILFAIDGHILHVTKGWDFYGPGGGYSFLAGRDASRALALMSLEPASVDDPRVDDLTDEQRDTLQQWVDKLSQKYQIIGRLIPSGAGDEQTAEAAAQKSGDAAAL